MLSPEALLILAKAARERVRHVVDVGKTQTHRRFRLGFDLDRNARAGLCLTQDHGRATFADPEVRQEA